MNAPLVSFCIPTYNRSRYLDSLLQSLSDHLAAFPFSHEVFISDNASTDETPEVVARYADRLPLRSVRHETNRGGRANYQYMMAQAKGRYVIYVADDDCVMGAEVARAIEVMEANPHIGIAYAPWRLLDLVADKDLGQFYRQDRDVLVPQGEHRVLLDTLLRYGIWPEIYICRREMVQSVMPRIHEQAYYAFVHASEFVEHSAVLFMKDSYYVSMTNYFADHQRVQGGTEEAEMAWDRYRSGLEYILGRASGQVTDMERMGFLLRIQDLVADRIATAVRLRMHNARDPVETYYLAYRLKALGGEARLPVALSTLRLLGVMGFLADDPELNRDVTDLVCLGTFEPDLRDLIVSKVKHTPRFVAHAGQLERLGGNTLVFARGNATADVLPPGSSARFVSEQQLMTKFPV